MNPRRRKGRTNHLNRLQKMKPQMEPKRRRRGLVKMTPPRHPPRTGKQHIMMLTLQTRLTRPHPSMTKEPLRMMKPPIAMAMRARMREEMVKGRGARATVS